jgi:hypothetical protein
LAFAFFAAGFFFAGAFFFTALPAGFFLAAAFLALAGFFFAGDFFTLAFALDAALRFAAIVRSVQQFWLKNEARTLPDRSEFAKHLSGPSDSA